MSLNSIFKGVFFCVLKEFDQSIELQAIANKSLQFYIFLT